MSCCRPHDLDFERWLPGLPGTRPEDHPVMQCRHCGQGHAVQDTTPAERRAIREGLAAAARVGAAYVAVADSVTAYFNYHLGIVESR